MRLSAEQKAAALAANLPAGSRATALVRLPAGFYGRVWHEAAQKRPFRWRGRLIKAVKLDGLALELVGERIFDVVWTGSEFFAATRRDVVSQLKGEALV